MEATLGKRLFLVALVVSVTATAAIAVFILVFAEFDDTAGRILGTTGLVGAFCLLALPCGVLLDPERARSLALAGAQRSTPRPRRRPSTRPCARSSGAARG